MQFNTFNSTQPSACVLLKVGVLEPTCRIKGGRAAPAPTVEAWGLTMISEKLKEKSVYQKWRRRRDVKLWLAAGCLRIMNEDPTHNFQLV